MLVLALTLRLSDGCVDTVTLCLIVVVAPPCSFGT